MFGQIEQALRHLNPVEVQRLAGQGFLVGLLAADEAAYRGMVRFLLPAGVSPQKARLAGGHAFRVEREEDCGQCDFGLAEPDLDRPTHFYPYEPAQAGRAVDLFVERQEHLWIPVARHFLPFRSAVVERLIRKIARENAMFAVATSIPNLAPSLLQLPWTVGEFASDAAFMTMNQIRLAFLLAAASDAPLGYLEQKAQISSIIAAAFGWRALARELVSKVPFGGGLVAKGMVAFAGTYVVGRGLERYLRLGRGLTAAEKSEHFGQAFQRGRAMVEEIVAGWKGGNSR